MLREFLWTRDCVISLRCSADQFAILAWLTLQGLSRAHACEFPSPELAVPHFTKKRGCVVQEVEDQLGVIIRLIDGYDDWEAVVTLVGVWNQVEVAKVVLGWVAKGMQSAFSCFNKMV